MTATKKFDPLTAPLSEVLDWLAERDGWVAVRSGSNGSVRRCIWRKESHFQTHTTDSHPITLDRLAGMLPEGWRWDMMFQHDEGWHVETMGNKQTFTGNGPTELEARARVVAAVLMKPHGG